MEFSHSDEFIFIKVSTTIEKVSISDVYAIESNGNYCTIKIAEKEFVLRSTLTRFKEEFKPYGFVQVNKSTLIQIDNIDRIDLSINRVLLTNQHQISLSRNYRKPLLDQLHLY